MINRHLVKSLKQTRENVSKISIRCGKLSRNCHQFASVSSSDRNKQVINRFVPDNTEHINHISCFETTLAIGNPLIRETQCITHTAGSKPGNGV